MKVDKERIKSEFLDRLVENCISLAYKEIEPKGYEPTGRELEFESEFIARKMADKLKLIINEQEKKK